MRARAYHGCSVMVLAGCLLLSAPPAYAAGDTGSHLDSAGNVEFEVEGEASIRFASQARPCDDKSEGAIRYNKVKKAFEGCNGTVWANVGDSTPTGAVEAFNLVACPAGWSPLAAAAGRTIIGAGLGTGLTNRPLGSMGGEETHVLTISEMPKHAHAARTAIWPAASVFGMPYPVHDIQYVPGADVTITNETGQAGSDLPHNIMQPYLALLYCQKN